MKFSPLAASLLLMTATTATRADMAPFFIGVDGRTTVPSGIYAGLDDPNAGRLTLLYNHGDHYHAKGVFGYAGPNLGVDTEVTVSPSNYIPEGSAEPFALTPGTGAFAGLYVSGSSSYLEGESIRIGSTEALRGYAEDADETLLLNSSGGRWNGSIADADLVIELVSATSGLSILNAAGLPIFTGGTSFALGLADAALNFAPIFAASAPGDYSAMFRVHDAREDGFGSSGVFEFRFNAAAVAVPEPAGLVMATTAGLASIGVALRRRRSPARSV